jgi:hypothetical protein
MTTLNVTGTATNMINISSNINVQSLFVNRLLTFPTNTITTMPTLALGSFAFWNSNGLMLWKCWNTNGTTTGRPTTP